MNKKLAWYNRYGVEEYYLYEPEDIRLFGWQRQEGQLEVIDPVLGWVSPRLDVRFELGSEGLELYRPDGQRFLDYIELDTQREEAVQRAEQEAQRAEKLAAKLRELNIDPDLL
jgi:Uma2 family endonuclease